MSTIKRLPYLIAVGFVLWFGVTVAGAADTQGSDNDDPPDRVARISFLNGKVSLKPAGTDDWADAALNRPLTTDDQLWVDRNARAELQTGPVEINLDQGTAFSLSELSDNVLQARITDGAVHLNVRRLQDGETIEIDTPHAAITLTQPGEYHIEIVDNGARTLVKTYSGECEIAGDRESTRLHAHEQVTLSDSDQAVADREPFSPRNDFDAWSKDRNERSTRAASAQYVAPDVIGYQDLDGNGDWQSEPDYGNVWYPSHVAVDWSPYRYGHWAWVAPWGWTWVDDAPWGFAPFHYGRWAYVHDRWGWVPGPIHVHAVYAPALVAWVGTPGPRIGVSISFGSNVGWFPLAPREVYVPGYNCSRQHIHNINYANTVIVNNVIINRAYVNRSTFIDYRNRNIRDAVTVVRHDAFVGARTVNDHRVRVVDGDLRGWQTHNATPAIAPDRASPLGPHWNANASRTPPHWNNESANREVVVHRTPPPARASFEQEQRAIRENNNRPIARRELWSGNRTEQRTDAPRNVGAVSSLPRLDQPRSDQPRTDQSRDGASGNNSPRRGFDRPSEEQHPTPMQRGDAQRNATPNVQPAPSQQNDHSRDNGNWSRERDNSPRYQREQRNVFTPPANTAPNAAPPINAPRAEPPRVREMFERQRNPDRTEQRAPEQSRPEQSRPEQPRNVERPRPAENATRVEAPRHAEPPPPPREQHAQPHPAPPPPANEKKEKDEQRREHGERRDRA